MAPKVERVVEDVILGEGPHWDSTTETLFFVDVYGNAVVRYTPSTNKVKKASVAPKKPSFIIPIEDKKDHFIITLDNQLTLIKWGEDDDQITIIEKVCVLDDGEVKCGLRINDGQCDPLGRLWAGTIGLHEGSISDIPPVGTLYTIDSKREVKSHVYNVKISNGMTFNPKIGQFYYIDSLKFAIDAYDCDLDSGAISNGRELFKLKNHDIPGIPDGITIDTDGNLWVAIFGGNRVIKIDGTKEDTLLDTIMMPTNQVTSLTFGGKNLDELYVTTGSLKLGDEELPRPVNGSTYKITGTGAKGLPGVSYKLECGC